jgi:hypothetical protein
MELRDHLISIATNLVHELEPVLAIKAVTDNPVLLGAYAEACIRRLVQRVVTPMQVSTGAVLEYPAPDRLRQLDIIIWAPFPAPAAYTVADFALVPKSSAFGVLEVKRSNYTGTDESLDAFLQDPGPVVTELDASLGETRSAVMAVVPVLERNPSPTLRRLLGNGSAVAIFGQEAERPRVRSKDVFALVNFLQYISWRYRFRAAQPWVPQVDFRSLDE